MADGAEQHSEALLQQMEREEAAMKIQAVHRGNAARSKLEARLSSKEARREVNSPRRSVHFDPDLPSVNRSPVLRRSSTRRIEKLKELASLKRDGILDEDEFQEEKKRILAEEGA